jgi:hypothetical protein
VVLDTLVSAIDALIDTDPFALSDGPAIELLQRESSRMEAALTKATAAFDARRNYEADGATTTATWVASRTNLPLEKAKRRVHLGRELRAMPLVDDAWCAGDIGEAQVGVLANARTPGTVDAFTRDEEMLVRDATRLRFSSLVRSLRMWRYRNDRDRSESDADAQRGGRKCHVSQSWEDMWFGDFILDPINGEIFNNELTRLEQQFFEEDWKEARARLGDDACAADLCRTPAQRRADALVEMAIRSHSMPAGSRRPEPLFTVLVGWETFEGMICETARRRFVTPGSLVPWLDTAWVERVVFDTPSRVIDVGARRRIFDGATRKAVLVRDQECFHEFCETPAQDCQVDHIEPWSFGGRTVEVNGRAACGPHNRARNRPLRM